MIDPTTGRLLAFLHPAWMVASLAFALATARLGLAIRRARVLGEVPAAGLRRRHLQLGKASIVAIVAGFVTGPLSMAWVRDRPVFESFHGIVGLIVTGLFLWTAHSGRALSRGDFSSRGLHRALAGASLATALLAAVAGFALLP